MRYWIESAYSNRINPTVAHKLPLLSSVDLEMAASTKLNWKNVNTLDYGGTLKESLCSAANIQLRMSQHNLLDSTASLTHLLLIGEGRIPFFSYFSLFARVGWYERWGRLSNVIILPTPFFGDFRQHDFALAIGTEVPISSDWTFKATVSTFDHWEVYNLNNPYAEGELTQNLSDGTSIAVLFRYQVLLGFGRWDRLMLGVHYWF